MKKKIILVSLIVLVVAIFLIAFRYSKNEQVSVDIKSDESLRVAVQSAGNSRMLAQNIQYPALTAGDQEITLTAQAAGVITQLNFSLGSKVVQGARLMVIDNIGNFSSIGENNLESSAIQSLEFAVESAEDNYKVAKDNYKNDDSYANKKAKSIASNNLKIAKTALAGALDARYAVSPISGAVTGCFVSQGDSVAVGQKLATISKTGLTKVQFYIDKEDLANFKIGTKVTINEDGNEIPGSVSKISPQADAATRRFLIEAKPQNNASLIIGNVIYVTFENIKKPADPKNLILPLSIMAIGQNENYIFIAEDGKAKKVQVEIIKVLGEAAEIKADLEAEAQIITDGSKLVQDGDAISVASNK